jgi:hypothetical protein
MGDVFDSSLSLEDKWVKLDPSKVISSSNPDNKLSTATTEFGNTDFMQTGIWEHEPGVSTDTEVEEVFVVISGTGKVTCIDSGKVLGLSPGVVGTFATGTRTQWEIFTPLRKVFINLKNPAVHQQRPAPAPFAGSRERAVEPTATVFVMRYSSGTSEQDMEAKLSEFGNILKCVRQQSKFTFCCFDDIESATQCVETLHGSNNFGSDKGLLCEYSKKTKEDLEKEYLAPAPGHRYSHSYNRGNHSSNSNYGAVGGGDRRLDGGESKRQRGHDRLSGHNHNHSGGPRRGGNSGGHRG